MRSFALAGLTLLSILSILTLEGVALTESGNSTQNMTTPMNMPNYMANGSINIQNVTLNFVLIQNLTENRNTIIPASINAGACDTTCIGGKQCINGACTCPTTSPDQCSGVCVNKSTDTSNCGACGTTCTNDHGATQCKNGYCGPTCSIGYRSCDGNNNNGCEANLLTDSKNCGACGLVCPTGATCVDGTCKGPAVPSCGDGVKASTEGCDDGNTVNGDGCSSVCTVEQGYQCVGQPSVCKSG